MLVWFTKLGTTWIPQQRMPLGVPPNPLVWLGVLDFPITNCAACRIVHQNQKKSCTKTRLLGGRIKRKPTRRSTKSCCSTGSSWISKQRIVLHVGWSIKKSCTRTRLFGGLEKTFFNSVNVFAISFLSSPRLNKPEYSLSKDDFCSAELKMVTFQVKNIF